MSRIEKYYSPPGVGRIHAADNGKAVAVRRVNYLQCGIWLEAGDHEVRMKLEPIVWSWGLRLTAVGAVVCLFHSDATFAPGSGKTNQEDQRTKRVQDEKL